MGRPIKASYFGSPKGTGTGGEGVASIAISGTNNNYSAIPTVTIGAPNVAGGTQAVATATIGAVSLAIVAGGSGYTANDVLTIVGGTGTAGTLTVSTVDGGGAITAAVVTTSGEYTAKPTNPVSVTGGTGTLATFNITYKLKTITVTTEGAGYTSAPTVTTGGNGTTTATLTTTTGNAIAVSAYVVGGSSAVAGDIISQRGSRQYKVATAQGTSVCKLVTGAPAEGEMNIVATCSAAHSKYASSTFNVAKLTSRLAYDVDGAFYNWSFDAAAGDVVQISNV